jgi:hypothetical protein
LRQTTQKQTTHEILDKDVQDIKGIKDIELESRRRILYSREELDTLVTEPQLAG